MAAKKKFAVDSPVYGVNLREEPDGRILPKVLPNGTAVEVTERRDGWAKVDGGWIRLIYLK